MRHDQDDSRCRVFTYKEGLLSAVAHDLELEVGRFQVTREGERLTAVFEANSVRVLHAVEGGKPQPDALSARDRDKIQANALNEVLDARKYPQIKFTASVAQEPGERLGGELELCGRRRTVQIDLRVEGDNDVGEVTLHQPDFGIKPYSAMLGALRIKPDVRVRIELPRAPRA